jgi:hypothetical protein
LDFGREVVELADCAEFVEVEDEASDGDAEVCGLAAGEGTVGKALQGESDGWVVGGFDPGLLSPEVWLLLQSLTSGAEAPVHSYCLNGAAEVVPLQRRNRRFLRLRLRRRMTFVWVGEIRSTHPSQEREGWGTLIAETADP